MSRFASLAVVSVASLGMTLATPEVSQAQFGLHLDIGRSHFEYGRGPRHGHYHDYGYDSFRRAPRHGHSHHGYYQDHHYRGSRRPIVVPDYYHWTPDRGYHSHGQIVVPHRGHYHVRPY
jgi:hypothetical protein